MAKLILQTSSHDRSIASMDTQPAEENSIAFMTRMWAVVKRDEEYPETVEINTRDFHRLCEGYEFWRQSISDPDRLRTYALLLKIANETKD